MRCAVACIMGALLVAGCTGRDFVKPAPESLSLGVTPQDEVVAKYGQPYRQSTEILSGAGAPNAAVRPAGTYNHLVYYYADRAALMLPGGRATERLLGFDFWNGKLYGYNFLSNFNSDSSNFDESKATQMERGRSTTDEVLDLLGPPTGQGVYPAIMDPSDRKFIYSYIAVQDQRRISKRLEILFSRDGKVRDFGFASDSGPAPAPAGGGTVPVYVPPPRGK